MMEWLLIGISVGFVAVLCFQLKSVARVASTVLLISLGVTLVSAKLWQDQRLEQAQQEQAFQRTIPREGRPGGFVTSNTCQSCHPNEHASWHMSYHRTMTQYATPETVHAEFDHPPLEHLSSPIQLERRGDEFWVELDDPDWVAMRTANPQRFSSREKAPRVERRIGMVTGSHNMQVFWVPGAKGNLQHLFAYSYLLDDQRWVPFNSTFLRDPKIPDYTQLWNLNCMNCHASFGQPRADIRSRELDTRTAEMGIACESCHGAAEKHVAFYRNPLNRYQASRDDGVDETIVNPAKLDSRRSSMVCGQCHGISWISDSQDYQQNGFRFRPGELLNQNRKPVRAAHLETQPYLKEPLQRNPRFLSDRFWPDGMVRVSGREYSGMMESPCHLDGDLSCLSCHELHHPEPQSQAALDWRNDQLNPVGDSNQACLQCHESMAEDLSAHTHHAADSSGSNCYNCHMPHTTYGLLKAIRSHQIDSPTVQSSLDTGRPNACNLCHLDQTLDWTGKHLTEWFGQPQPTLNQEQKEVAAGLLWYLKGEAGQRALLAWHFGWEAAREASGEDWMAYAVAQGLVDPYSAVRYIAGRSLKRLPGMSELDYDFIGQADHRQRALEEARAIWSAQWDESGSLGTREVLFRSDGQPDAGRIGELIGNLDNRSMDLQE